MKQATAISPASISFIFKICKGKNQHILGSIGVGATIDKNIQVAVKKSRLLRVLFNGKKLAFPTVETVVRKLTKESAEVSIASSVPLACGFGVSGAASLATAYALDDLLKIRKKNEELASIAHEAEIENRTGLGSVATQITGGFLIKSTPGIPVHATNLPFVGQKLFALVLGRYETTKILKDSQRVPRINFAADIALGKISHLKNPNMTQILDISLEYAKESGILENEKTRRIIEGIKRQGGHATMAMLGQTIFTTLLPKKIDGQIIPFTISQTAAHSQ